MTDPLGEEYDFQHIDMEGMTPEQFAEWIEENESDDAWGEPVQAEVSKSLSSVVSVRFSPDELDSINAVAAAKGMKVSTFIRNIVMGEVAQSRKEATRAGVDGEAWGLVLYVMNHQAEIASATETLTSMARHLKAVKDIAA